MNEITNIIERYKRRNLISRAALYSPFCASQYMCQQEKERAIINWINNNYISPVNEKKVLEIGCGAGGNLLQLLKLGFAANHLVGIELLEDRAESARRRLPANVQILLGDASSIELPESTFDIVIQETVFSSILDDKFQQKLANRMWSLVRLGGGILWYDFIYDNPNNHDVRGMPLKRVKQLFPEADITRWRLTLAPPISRRITKIHPRMYSIANLLPFLRTHQLCWIKKC